MSLSRNDHSWTTNIATRAFAVAVFLLGVQIAPATDFVVTKNEDTNDGTCDGDCSLREAIIAANTAPGADAIVLSTGTYHLSIPGIDEDSCATGDLDLLDHTTINGVDRTSTIIDGGGIDRVIHVPGGSLDVTLMDLTLTNGDTSAYTSDADGGGVFFKRLSSNTHLSLIRVGLTNNQSLHGGAGLATSVDTLIYRSVISSNYTVPGEPASGGGISFAYDNLHILESEISNNQANSKGAISMYGGTVIIDRSIVTGNSAAFTGGIGNFIGDLRIYNSTISGNTGLSGDSGAITLSGNGATLSMRFSTVADNTGNPGGILNYSVVAELANTIVANNIGGDCSGDLGISGGHNLSSDATCGFAGVGDMQNTDPLLEPLQDNGGPTQTHALDAASPTIDAADPSAFELHDQRGYERPSDGDANGSYLSDIGAFEHAAIPPIFTDGFETGDTSAWSG